MKIKDKLFKNYVILVEDSQYVVGKEKGKSIRDKRYFSSLSGSILYIVKCILSERKQTVNLNGYIRQFKNLTEDFTKTIDRKRRAKRRKDGV